MALTVLFGANVDPLWEEPHYPLRLADQVDASGLDYIAIQDHPYQSKFYDAWTLLTFLAARTQNVTFVPTVANLPLRPPAVLAKAAASLALLSGGRVHSYWAQARCGTASLPSEARGETARTP
jgi:alkanesulfonate monooxygenase SsuD/methylene tetrahydromethanopterin reductase-like flavin-dependent oxidoreductase (luciferase family)